MTSLMYINPALCLLNAYLWYLEPNAMSLAGAVVCGVISILSIVGMSRGTNG